MPIILDVLVSHQIQKFVIACLSMPEQTIMPQRCVIILMSGDMTLEECASFLAQFDVNSTMPPRATDWFEHPVRVTSGGFSWLCPAPPVLLYFCERLRGLEFTDEYTFHVHQHILSCWCRKRAATLNQPERPQPT